MPEFRRKHIRLPAENYRGLRLYVVTLCFDHRGRFGANPRIASWLISRIEKHAPACDFSRHAYCVMPDNMHVRVPIQRRGAALKAAALHLESFFDQLRDGQARV